MFSIHQREYYRAARLLEGYCSIGSSNEIRENIQHASPCRFNNLTVLFERAGSSAKTKKNLLLRIVFSVAAGLGLAMAGKPFCGGCFIVAALAFEYLELRRRIFSRAERFERDYPAMLLSLASSIRTGMDPLVALCNVSTLFPSDSVVRGELEQLKSKVDSGITEQDAINSFGCTILHPDIKLFTTAFFLARKEGSSLGECLQRLTKVTRLRQSFRRKARSAIAMQRLSAFGIALCSVLIGGMQITANPEAFFDAWSNPFGFKAIIFGGIFLGTGLLWMLCIGRGRI